MALKSSILQASKQKAAPTASVAEPLTETVQRSPKRSPRAESKSIGFWTSRDAHRTLHLLALNHDKTAERLMNEALNLLFRHYDKPTIAPVPDSDIC